MTKILESNGFIFGRFDVFKWQFSNKCDLYKFILIFTHGLKIKIMNFSKIYIILNKKITTSLTCDDF